MRVSSSSWQLKPIQSDVGAKQAADDTERPHKQRIQEKMPAVCLVDAEQAVPLTGVREEIQKAKSEIQAKMGERIKESRTEIEQDLITPLKNKMVIVDEKVDH